MVGYPGTRLGQPPPAPPTLSDGLIFLSQISNISSQTSSSPSASSSSSTLLRSVGMTWRAGITGCHRKCFHGERLPATNKAVTIAGRGRAGLTPAWHCRPSCHLIVVLPSQWEVTITILRIIPIQSLTPISSLGREMRGSAKYFPRENVRIIF